MLAGIVAFVAKHAGKERPIAIRVLSLILGIITFLVVAPLAIGAVGHLVARLAQVRASRALEVPLGVSGIALGLLFLLWSVSAFWFVGKGTPVPFASPTRLVTSGPFRYTRNPIKLGAILFYFGIGTICDQLVTGLTMLVLGSILGSIYHKCVEEKELVMRFGKEYEDYRKRTSFLLPLPPRQ